MPGAAFLAALPAPFGPPSHGSFPLPSCHCMPPTPLSLYRHSFPNIPVPPRAPIYPHHPVQTPLCSLDFLEGDPGPVPISTHPGLCPGPQALPEDAAFPAQGERVVSHKSQTPECALSGPEPQPHWLGPQASVSPLVGQSSPRTVGLGAGVVGGRAKLTQLSSLPSLNSQHRPLFAA